MLDHRMEKNLTTVTLLQRVTRRSAQLSGSSSATHALSNVGGGAKGRTYGGRALRAAELVIHIRHPDFLLRVQGLSFPQPCVHYRMQIPSSGDVWESGAEWGEPKQSLKIANV